MGYKYSRIKEDPIPNAIRKQKIIKFYAQELKTRVVKKLFVTQRYKTKT